MKIFYIDTSTNYLYAGVASDTELLCEIKLNLSHDLSTFSVDEISKMFKEHNIEVNDIDKIICVSGPGSFTGIRIGMTISKIYALMLKKEITTITSLEAMSSSIKTDKMIVPLIDARRGYVYAGIYYNNDEIIPNQYISLEKLKLYIEGQNKDYIVITNDNILIDNINKYNPDILNIINNYKDREGINPHKVEPTYLKLTEAEENREKELKND